MKAWDLLHLITENNNNDRLSKVKKKRMLSELPQASEQIFVNAYINT